MAEEKVRSREANKADPTKEPLGKDAVKAKADKVKRLRAALGNAVPRADKIFRIKNVVRRVQTRLRRASAPGRLRFRQHVAGRRLLRGQTMTLRPEVFEKCSEQILKGVLAGALEITDPDGVRYFADGMGNLCKQEPGKPVEKRDPPKPEPELKDEDLELESAETEPPTEEELETKPVETMVDTVVDPTMDDDLTEIPGVGPGRAKKLLASAITTFKQVAEMAPADLVKVVGSPLTEDQAADICDAASKMEG